ncbi:MAG: kinase-like domain-containing protein [Monoraphidium minutum]|nr:MAG: kinase-like domain-containing protein [Monoraphidium minutum]
MLGLVLQAELIAAELGVDLAAIYAHTNDAAPRIVLLAASGAPAALLERTVVSRAAPGAARPLAINDAAAAEAWRDVPPHLRPLKGAACSIAAVPLGPATRPLGSLVLADSRPHAFDGPKWQMRLQAAAMAVLRVVRQQQVAHIAEILSALDDAPGPLEVVSTLLRASTRYMASAANMRAATRLALLRGAAPAAAAPDAHRAPDALLFEAPRGGRPSEAGAPTLCGRARPAVLPGDATAEVAASRMALGNTLLASAVKHQQARFSCPLPAKDVFSRAAERVSSIVVVPLIPSAGPPLGGLYFALDAPCDFEHFQETLLAERRLSFGSVVSGDTSRELDRSGSSGGGAGSSSPRPPPSSRLSASGAHLNTEAMLQVLQQEVRKSWRRGLTPHYLPELVVAECLASSSSGAVYRGYWHKSAAAVKITYNRSTEREAMGDAVEMAVLSSVQHPNIVKTYACLTDMVEAAPDGGSTSASIGSIGSAGSLARPARICYRRLAPEESPGDARDLCNMIVMEYCDRGTLRATIDRGAFHARLPGGGLGVNLPALAGVLLDVAAALQYLHTVQLVHGDVRPENILLKTDPSRDLGVTPKLCNFGLAKILNESETAVSFDAGAATHRAPETLAAGADVTAAVDAYAFGILLWEVYTGARPYAGVDPAALPAAVAAGLRPQFPRGAPAGLAALAARCWAADPRDRPAMAEVAAALEALHSELAPRAPPPPAGAGAAPAAPRAAAAGGAR